MKIVVEPFLIAARRLLMSQGAAQHGMGDGPAAQVWSWLLSKGFRETATIPPELYGAFIEAGLIPADKFPRSDDDPERCV